MRGYLGFRFFTFATSEEPFGYRYGWLDLTVNTDGSGVVHSFAYEDGLNVGILAGSTESLATPQVPLPATLPLLVVAAGGLAEIARLRRGVRARG